MRHISWCPCLNTRLPTAPGINTDRINAVTIHITIPTHLILSPLSTHRELELLIAAEVPGGEAVAVARLVRALGGVEGQQVAALHARHAQPPACAAR